MKPAALVAAAIVTGIYAGLVSPPFAAAAGDPLCPPGADTARRFSPPGDERAVAEGLASSAAGGGIMEIYASPGGAWAVVLITADGVSRLLTRGTDFESPARPAAGETPQ